MAMNKSLKEMLRFVSTDESQALQDICEYNDISEEQLMDPENIKTLEMFLFNFPRICCMTFFPNLTSLSLVQQNLRSIEGLHCLPHLEILRLSENEIQRIEGLSNCLKLKEILLHNNCITRISNLSHLTNLRVLWLANNLIRWVDGLENLQLKELNLARNPLTQLGNILKVKSLKYLNVSATDIGSFKEIGNLTRLKKLKDLRFSDPHWGPSPLSLLHNYQTYILFRLQNLQKLDTLELTAEAKQAARVTYTRKRVYYSMCIKSLQQSRANVNTFPVESKRIKGLQKTLKQLVRASKDVEKNMVDGADTEKSVSGLTESPERGNRSLVHCRNKAATLDEHKRKVLNRLDFLNKELQLSRAREQAAIDLNIHWLMVELDSGGNIRMEIGNTKDVWYKSCVELVMSRFFADDYTPLGISGVQVHNVTRIHNRFLQDQFERQHETKMLKSGNKNVEYLLCGETFQAPDELQRIVEGGFPLSPERVAHGCSSPVVLSNSVGLADRCRLKIFADQPHTEVPKGRTTGWLLVVKTCLGTSVKDVRCKYTQIPRRKEFGGSNKVDGEGSVLKKTSYPHADSVYRSHPTDSKQRSWFVFDAALVVPEYLVEFDYFFNSNTPGGQTPSSPGISGEGVECLTDMSKLMDLSDSDLSQHQNCDRASMECTDCPPCEARNLDASVSGRPSTDLADPVVKLSVEYILKMSCASNLQSMTNLNLHGSNLYNVDVLRGLGSLKILILSFNNISKMTGLDELPLLEELDLSYNLVARIEGLNGLDTLRSLDLGGNQIWNPSDFTYLHSQVPTLSTFNLRDNPIADDMEYPMMVLRALPSLVELDSNPISSEERVEADRKYVSSPALLFAKPRTEWGYLLPFTSALSVPSAEKDLQSESRSEGGNDKGHGEIESDALDNLEDRASLTNDLILKRLDDPFRLSPYRMSPCRVCPCTVFPRSDMAERRGELYVQPEADRAWYDDVEEVHLEHHKLKTMHCFDKLPNLRRLFLSGNEITVIEGLDNCSLLEELVLEDNLITQVPKLKHVKALWRLDLRRNRISCCGEIPSFEMLEQLSIDNNKIDTLKGLENLSSLMELYASDNLLSELSELNYIRGLQKLIVVDFSGNSLCDCHDYRMYTVFTLRKLKVLDGRNVESNELTQSRNKYSGRLTRDMLEDFVGHSQFSKLEVLDLSGQRLRSCGEVFESSELRGLTELNLNDNLLTSVHPLRFLENLRILHLENNKFEDRPLFEAPSDGVGVILYPEPFSISSEMDRLGRTSACAASTSDDQNLSLQSLEILKLGGNTITSIASLSLYYKFPMLRLLALQDNKISKVDGLGGLSSLEKLYLDHNEIRELEPLAFAQLQSLRVLRLANNALKTLVHLSGLAALECLDLSSNNIAPNRLGGLASVDNLSGLTRLVKLSFINNPISRQNLYRISVISRLLHLHYLDEREITEEERHEAEGYAAGTKESAPLLMDSNALADNHSNSTPCLGTGGQIKVPLKVTSLNFESMCLQQSPRGTYQITNPSKQTRVTVYNHVSPTQSHSSSTVKWEMDDPKHQLGVLRRCFDKSQLVRGKGKGENKVITIPYSTYVKTLSPSKDRVQKAADSGNNRAFAMQ
ncbi:hypothetical protein MPTK2_3g14780 [Marchantia polymorpha subsp. ruderalis]